MAKEKIKVGDIVIEIDSTVMKDARFLRLLSTIQSRKTDDMDKGVAFYDMCDFLFGQENVDLIMDEIAKENDGVCSLEVFQQWLIDTLNNIADVKNS